ncbi:MAG: hypothetical protein SFU21_15155 [Flavihumibacter sp.]|nr:hypothetical protein [Flavihumibacter sp.]
MAKINEIVCGFNLTGGNTDVGSCVFTPAPVAGMFLSYGKVFTPAEQANMKAALDAALIAANRSNRLYPVHNITEAEDKSAEKQTSTTGYGDEIVTRAKKLKSAYKIVKGGLTMLQKLSVHSDVCTQVFLYDQKNRLLGYKDAAGNLCPFDLTQFFVDTPPELTGSNFFYSPIELAFASNDQKVKDFAWVNADSENFSLSALKGIKDVVLAEQVAMTNAGVFVVRGEVGPTKDDLRTTYGAALAQTAAWKCRVKDTGAAVTVSAAVVHGASSTGYQLTVDEVALPANTVVEFYLADIPTLQAAPVNLPATAKIESNYLAQVVS